MSSNEIVNQTLAQVSFLAANPPVIYARNANIRDVVRLSAGVYRVELVNPIPPTGQSCPVNFQATAWGAAASFAQAIENGGNGQILVTARNLAGVEADTQARIDVLVTAYPTVG